MRPLPCAAGLAALVAGAALCLAGTPARAGTVPRSLRLSPDLWATIDVCDTPRQPNTIGVRGSMPGDANAHHKMFMRFRLQYLDHATGHWTDLPKAASEYLPLGAANTARQGGRSFRLMPHAGEKVAPMRGVITFQWRRGGTVLSELSRATTAGHKSLAGAEPPSFSAATCQIR
jgi:hypothetical protein